MFRRDDQLIRHKNTLMLLHHDDPQPLHKNRSRAVRVVQPHLLRTTLTLVQDDLRHPLKIRLMLLHATVRRILKITSTLLIGILHLPLSRFNQCRPNGPFSQIHA
jgi:hypothetical protein